MQVVVVTVISLETWFVCSIRNLVTGTNNAFNHFTFTFKQGARFLNPQLPWTENSTWCIVVSPTHLNAFDPSHAHTHTPRKSTHEQKLNSHAAIGLTNRTDKSTQPRGRKARENYLQCDKRAFLAASLVVWDAPVGRTQEAFTTKKCTRQVETGTAGLFFSSNMHARVDHWSRNVCRLYIWLFLNDVLGVIHGCINPPPFFWCVCVLVCFDSAWQVDYTHEFGVLVGGCTERSE